MTRGKTYLTYSELCVHSIVSPMKLQNKFRIKHNIVSHIIKMGTGPHWPILGDAPFGFGATLIQTIYGDFIDYHIHVYIKS